MQQNLIHAHRDSEYDDEGLALMSKEGLAEDAPTGRASPAQFADLPYEGVPIQEHASVDWLSLGSPASTGGRHLFPVSTVPAQEPPSAGSQRSSGDSQFPSGQSTGLIKPSVLADFGFFEIPTDFVRICSSDAFVHVIVPQQGHSFRVTPGSEIDLASIACLLIFETCAPWVLDFIDLATEDDPPIMVGANPQQGRPQVAFARAFRELTLCMWVVGQVLPGLVFYASYWDDYNTAVIGVSGDDVPMPVVAVKPHSSTAPGKQVVDTIHALSNARGLSVGDTLTGETLVVTRRCPLRYGYPDIDYQFNDEEDIVEVNISLDVVRLTKEVAERELPSLGPPPPPRAVPTTERGARKSSELFNRTELSLGLGFSLSDESSFEDNSVHPKVQTSDVDVTGTHVQRAELANDNSLANKPPPAVT